MKKEEEERGRWNEWWFEEKRIRGRGGYCGLCKVGREIFHSFRLVVDFERCIFSLLARKRKKERGGKAERTMVCGV